MCFWHLSQLFYSLPPPLPGKLTETCALHKILLFFFLLAITLTHLHNFGGGPHLGCNSSMFGSFPNMQSKKHLAHRQSAFPWNILEMWWGLEHIVLFSSSNFFCVCTWVWCVVGVWYIKNLTGSNTSWSRASKRHRRSPGASPDPIRLVITMAINSLPALTARWWLMGHTYSMAACFMQKQHAKHSHSPAGWQLGAGNWGPAGIARHRGKHQAEGKLRTWVCVYQYNDRRPRRLCLWHGVCGWTAYAAFMWNQRLKDDWWRLMECN